MQALAPSWGDLPPDAYLRDRGRYRRRRHACCIVDGNTVQPVPHRAHWQPLEYNALHGGLQRWFEPIVPAVLAQTAWQRLLVALAALCSARKGAQPWFVEAHQFRLDTTDGPAGLRFTMTQPWTTLLLDDQRVIHESTPIQPLATPAHRDTLVLTFRSRGFQGPG